MLFVGLGLIAIGVWTAVRAVRAECVELGFLAAALLICGVSAALGL